MPRSHSHSVCFVLFACLGAVVVVAVEVVVVKVVTFIGLSSLDIMLVVVRIFFFLGM